MIGRSLRLSLKSKWWRRWNVHLPGEALVPMPAHAPKGLLRPCFPQKLLDAMG